MNTSWRKNIEDLLAAWIGMVEKFRIAIIVLTGLSIVYCVHYSIDHLGMNTDTRDMLSPKLEWRKLDMEIDANFPKGSKNILVVVEAPTPDEASDTADLLYHRIQGEAALFKSMYYPAGSGFFNKNALLFLDTGELQDLADNLAAIQPFLGRLTADQSLRGLFNMLNDALQARQEGNEIDLIPMLKRLQEAFIAEEQDQHYILSWQSLMGGSTNKKKPYREFIVLQPILDYSNIYPAAIPMKKLRNIITGLDLNTNNNIRVRLTGSAALAYEEMKSVSKGTTVSAIASFIMVTLLLLVGLRSLWLTIVSMIILVCGLVYTAWFAAITVGELNLISVAFAVLYIGLGADFAIHYCLHYRDALYEKHDNHIALHETTIDTGMALILCTSTTAVSFYAFMPTDYRGVAELGWISGTGMLICLFVTLTLLPALLSLFPLKKARPGAIIPGSHVIERLRNVPIKHARKIKLATVILTIAAIFIVRGIEFDHNTLNLQSPKNESVKTYLDLLADSDTSPWTSTMLAHSPAEADQFARRLEKLPLVSKVVWLRDFIPDNQDEKLQIIQEIDWLLGPLSFSKNHQAVNDIDNLMAIQKFNGLLQELAKDHKSTVEYDSMQKIVARFLAKMESLDVPARHAVLEQLQHKLLSAFPGRLNALLQSLQAEPFTEQTLSPEVKERWVNNNNYRLEIYPKENLMDNIALRKFTAQVRAEVHQVTGVPVTVIEASKAVITAFKQAFTYAFLATCLLLLLLTERRIDVIYILTPLLLAALFTGALSVLIGIKLNFANIIALPLLLGMGLDSAIYILHGLRTEVHNDSTLLTNTSSLAVILSALTTILSIGNLSFSPHLGTASMGKLLTIGLVMTLVCSLIILPSLLSKQLKR